MPEEAMNKTAFVKNWIWGGCTLKKKKKSLFAYDDLRGGGEALEPHCDCISMVDGRQFRSGERERRWL